MKAFYFAANDKKLRYGDNREIVVGETHTVDCKPKCCEVGLHGSRRLIDALQYAPGHMLYLVEISGDVDESRDKICGTSRKYLAEFDAEDLLREFARMQALVNIEKIKPYCSADDYDLIIKWLKIGDKTYQSAAWSAARSARSAAESSARSAAESAAWSAADCTLTEMVRQATGWDI